MDSESAIQPWMHHDTLSEGAVGGGAAAAVTLVVVVIIAGTPIRRGGGTGDRSCSG